MDANIITILISAFGGALVSSLTGFLTIYVNNKHSFRMAKEKDKYEYGQYTNRMLYKYLEELERECLFYTHVDLSETLDGANGVRTKIQTVYTLVKPFLCDETVTNLDERSNEELVSHKSFFEKYMSTNERSIDSDDFIKLNAWIEKLTLFRGTLISSIHKELRTIKNNRI